MGDLLSFLSPEDLVNIRTDVREAVLNFDSVLYGQPPSRPVSFIYRRMLTSSANLSTGAVTTTWQDTRVNGFGGIGAMYNRDMNDDRMPIGDQVIMFDPTALVAPPRDDDRVLLQVTFAGHVALINGSVNVQGDKTEFIKGGVQGGDLLLDCDVTGVYSEIASVQSDLGLTLKTAWAGSDLPYLKFEIFRSYMIADRKIDPMGALVRLGLRRAGT